SWRRTGSPRAAAFVSARAHATAERSEQQSTPSEPSIPPSANERPRVPNGAGTSAEQSARVGTGGRERKETRTNRSGFWSPKPRAETCGRWTPQQRRRRKLTVQGERARALAGAPATDLPRGDATARRSRP